MQIIRETWMQDVCMEENKINGQLGSNQFIYISRRSPDLSVHLQLEQEGE